MLYAKAHTPSVESHPEWVYRKYYDLIDHIILTQGYDSMPCERPSLEDKLRIGHKAGRKGV